MIFKLFGHILSDYYLGMIHGSAAKTLYLRNSLPTLMEMGLVMV